MALHNSDICSRSAQDLGTSTCRLEYLLNPSEESTRIDVERPRTVSDIPIQINITAGESDWVFGDESAEIRIVPAGPVAVESGEIVVLAAGEFVPGREIAVCVAE